MPVEDIPIWYLSRYFPGSSVLAYLSTLGQPRLITLEVHNLTLAQITLNILGDIIKMMALESMNIS